MALPLCTHSVGHGANAAFHEFSPWTLSILENAMNSSNKSRILWLIVNIICVLAVLSQLTFILRKEVPKKSTVTFFK